MYLNNLNIIINYQEKILDEIYNADVLINAAKSCCQEREFRGEYYGLSNEYIKKVSNERNEYISLLTLASDKIKNVHKLNKTMEQNLMLY